MAQKGWLAVKKSDVPHKNSSMYFSPQLILYSFLVSHEALIIPQRANENSTSKKDPTRVSELTI